MKINYVIYKGPEELILVAEDKLSMHPTALVGLKYDEATNSLTDEIIFWAAPNDDEYNSIEKDRIFLCEITEDKDETYSTILHKLTIKNEDEDEDIDVSILEIDQEQRELVIKHAIQQCKNVRN